MKKLLFFLAVFILCISTELFGQDKKFDFYFSGGISLPSQPDEFKDFWNMGFNFGGGIGYAFPHSTTSFIVYFDYNKFSFDEERFLRTYGFSGITVSGYSAHIFSISGNFKVAQNLKPNSISAYLIGGAGYFSLRISDARLYGGDSSTTVDEQSEFAFSVSGGAGVDIPISEVVCLFLEAKYAVGFTKIDYTGYVPLRVGVRFK